MPSEGVSAGLQGDEIVRAAQDSFTTAMALGMRVAAVIAIVSAFAAFALIPGTSAGRGCRFRASRAPS